jgi:hypothetical protein
VIAAPPASPTVTLAPIPSRAPAVASGFISSQSSPRTARSLRKKVSIGALREDIQTSRSPSPSQSTGASARPSPSLSNPLAALAVANRTSFPPRFRKHTSRS